MKSCPKCQRTFPDEGQKFCTFDGGLLIAPQAFDPNATMRATSSDLEAMAEKSTSRELPDPNATIVESYAATVALPRNTAPTGGVANTGDLNQTSPGNTPTPPPVFSSSDQTVALPKIPTEALPPTQAPPPPPAPLEPVVTTAASSPATSAAAAATDKKKSKLPLIIIGVVLALFLGGGALGAVFYFVVLPKINESEANQKANENQNQVAQNNTNVNVQPSPTEAPTPEVDNYVPPLGTANFENSNERLEGKLAERYFDFNFYYPESWQKDPAGANSFVKVERRLPPDFTQENFTVGWYTSSGTYDADLPNYPRLVEQFSNALSKNIPEYRKVSEGPTQVNKMKAYEFRWVGFTKGTAEGDLQLWGRVIFLPTGKEGDTTGATLTMLSTNLAPELASIDDLGVKGEAPVILESFRFGKKK